MNHIDRSIGRLEQRLGEGNIGKRAVEILKHEGGVMTIGEAGGNASTREAGGHTAFGEVIDELAEVFERLVMLPDDAPSLGASEEGEGERVGSGIFTDRGGELLDSGVELVVGDVMEAESQKSFPPNGA